MQNVAIHVSTDFLTVIRKAEVIHVTGDTSLMFASQANTGCLYALRIYAGFLF